MTVDEVIAEVEANVDPNTGLPLEIQRTRIRQASQRVADRGKDRDDDEFDRTQLHVHAANKSGDRVHRDYAAHYFRWGWAMRAFRHQHGEPGMKVLDVGSGADLPLMKYSEYPDQMPGELVCVDLNPLSTAAAYGGRERTKKWVTLYGETNFCDIENQRMIYRAHGEFDAIVCFEVIEHMTVEHGDELLDGFRRLLKPDGFIMLSTPVFDGVRARNHIHEYTIDELDAKIRTHGLRVEARYGTFASHHDARKGIAEWAEREGVDLAPITHLYSKLAEFHGTDVLSNYLAPVIPNWSRNNVWKLRHSGEA